MLFLYLQLIINLIHALIQKQQECATEHEKVLYDSLYLPHTFLTANGYRYFYIRLRNLARPLYSLNLELSDYYFSPVDALIMKHFNYYGDVQNSLMTGSSQKMHCTVFGIGTHNTPEKWGEMCKLAMARTFE